MKYTSKAFKHGQRLIKVSCEVSGEGSENVLVLAGESINTAAAGALDAAGKRVAIGDKTGDEKKNIVKDFTRDSFFSSAAQVEAAMKRVKAPERLVGLKVEDAGQWSGTTSDKGAEAYALLVPVVGVEKALEMTQKLYPNFRVAVAQPELPVADSDEGEKAD